MGRTANSAQSGRAGERAARIAKARRRRLELDTDRAARDVRIDEAVADAYLAQEERVAAQERVTATDVKIGTAILRILAEGSDAAGGGCGRAQRDSGAPAQGRRGQG